MVTDILVKAIGSLLHDVTWMVGAGARRLLLELSVHGYEHVPRRGPFILAANHRSLVDFIPVELVCRRKLLYLVHHAWYDPWPLRWFFKLMAYVRVEAGSANSPAFDQVLKALAEGRPVCLFPEGERSWTTKLRHGHPGAAYLALRSGVPLIPVAISGTERILPRGSWRLRYALVSLRFGPPIPLGRTGDREPTRQMLRLTTDRLMTAIATLLGADGTRC